VGAAAALASSDGVLHAGFAIESSMLYRTARFQPGKLPQDEPLHQWVPLVEFQVDATKGHHPTGIWNPGLSYVEQTWQFGAEAVRPMGRGNGAGKGFGVQLLWFIDNLMPSLFGKPVLARP
jgi:hypothetical protein